MAAIATVPAQQTSAGAVGARGANAPQAMNPFTRAARRKTETFLDLTAVLGASAVTLPQQDVPATGYLRHLWIIMEVTATGGTLTGDAPWNILDSVTLSDVNGQPIVILSGYNLFLANLFGGYAQHADPRVHPIFKSDATGFSFALRVPVEIVSRNALGALLNTNASMTYKLKITLAPSASVYSAAPSGAIAVHLRGVVESWAQPYAADLRGVANAVAPPALGTTQNWSSEVKPVVLNANTLRASRVGNAIRNLILVNRDNAGVRSAGGLPDELSLFLDGNQWHKAPTAYFIHRTAELYGYLSAALPAGVIVFCFTDDFDGTPGEEIGDYWLSTSGATRLELQGTWKAAGSLEIITNDLLAFAGSPGGAGATLGAQT